MAVSPGRTKALSGAAENCPPAANRNIVHYFTRTDPLDHSNVKANAIGQFKLQPSDFPIDLLRLKQL